MGVDPMKLTEKELDQELRDLPVAITLDAYDWACVEGTLNWARKQMKDGSSSAVHLARLVKAINTMNVAAMNRAEGALRK